MTATVDEVLALRNRGSGGVVKAERDDERDRPGGPRGTRRRRATAIARATPASVVTFAGVQGGAGVTSTTMLLATAVTAASDHQALAVDVAGATAGGLGGLARGWSQVPARAMAELMLSGARIERPYMTTAEGVHVISAPPDESSRQTPPGTSCLAGFRRRCAAARATPSSPRSAVTPLRCVAWAMSTSAATRALQRSRSSSSALNRSSASCAWTSGSATSRRSGRCCRSPTSTFGCWSSDPGRWSTCARS